jgi:hypothetical protein
MKRIIISLASTLWLGLPLGFAACGADSSGDCTPGAGGNSAKSVANAVMVPMQRQDYAIDLNGDGRVDNQLGNIIGALEGQMLHVQDGVNTSVMNGTLVLLLNENSADATYQSDGCAASTVNVGKSVTTPPKFDGSDSFMIDTGQQGGTFAGPIKAGKFSSAPPATTKKPVTLSIQLPLVSGAAPVTLKVNGAHLQFTRSSSGMVTGGQLNGAIKSDDVQMNIIPNVATLLTNRVMADPTSSTNMQILSIFDNGGKADAACGGTTCKNPSYGSRPGMCAVAHDNIIDTCEVSTAGLIQNVLAPDVQMFDAAGNYAPNPNNTMKDSLSIGLAFTAVKASF